MSTDDVHEETVNGSKRTTTRSDVDVEDNPPESDEPEDDASDNALASWEDVTFARDDSGELAPVTSYVEEIGMDAKAKPMTDKQRERYVVDFLDDPEENEITDADLAELFTSNLLAPDLTDSPRCPDERVSERFVQEEMPQYFQDGCLIAVLLASDEYKFIDVLRGNYNDSQIEAMVRYQQAENNNDNVTTSSRGNRRGAPRGG